jgi:hypothetical protein
MPETRRDRIIRSAGFIGALAYAAAIAWLLVTQPRTVASLGGELAASVGLYKVDRASFDEGLRFFREDRFDEARIALARADPAGRDATTQFYVAYSFYRQGWGRVYNDDALFRQGLDALDRAVAGSPSGRDVVDDPGLGMHSSDELRAELIRGTTRDASDFSPLRVFRSRK